MNQLVNLLRGGLFGLDTKKTDVKNKIAEFINTDYSVSDRRRIRYQIDEILMNYQRIQIQKQLKYYQKILAK